MLVGEKPVPVATTIAPVSTSLRLRTGFRAIQPEFKHAHNQIDGESISQL